MIHSKLGQGGAETLVLLLKTLGILFQWNGEYGQVISYFLRSEAQWCAWNFSVALSVRLKCLDCIAVDENWHLKQINPWGLFQLTWSWRSLGWNLSFWDKLHSILYRGLSIEARPKMGFSLYTTSLFLRTDLRATSRPQLYFDSSELTPCA